MHLLDIYDALSKANILETQNNQKLLLLSQFSIIIIIINAFS